MKQTCLTASLVAVASAASAQWVVTNPISDVLTQLQHAAAYAVQANQYAQQVQAFQNQLKQYETQVKNLKEHQL
ncbi:hypothetical protein, partial [Massilia scottii]|uniref:hypothetical protein n=1 Tax=Massilia scottii TaxID=3057166 RepID=UPI0027964916